MHACVWSPIDECQFAVLSPATIAWRQKYIRIVWPCVEPQNGQEDDMQRQVIIGWQQMKMEGETDRGWYTSTHYWTDRMRGQAVRAESISIRGLRTTMPRVFANKRWTEWARPEDHNTVSGHWEGILRLLPWEAKNMSRNDCNVKGKLRAVGSRFN